MVVWVVVAVQSASLMLMSYWTLQLSHVADLAVSSSSLRLTEAEQIETRTSKIIAVQDKVDCLLDDLLLSGDSDSDQDPQGASARQPGSSRLAAELMTKLVISGNKSDPVSGIENEDDEQEDDVLEELDRRLERLFRVVESAKYELEHEVQLRRMKGAVESLREAVERTKKKSSKRRRHMKQKENRRLDIYEDKNNKSAYDRFLVCFELKINCHVDFNLRPPTHCSLFAQYTCTNFSTEHFTVIEKTAWLNRNDDGNFQESGRPNAFRILSRFLEIPIVIVTLILFISQY